MGIKLTEVIAVWERLHIKDTGDIGFSDLEEALDYVVGVNNDIPKEQPSLPVEF